MYRGVHMSVLYIIEVYVDATLVTYIGVSVSCNDLHHVTINRCCIRSALILHATLVRSVAMNLQSSTERPCRGSSLSP